MNLVVRCLFFIILFSGNLGAQSIIWNTSCADRNICMNPGSCTEGTVNITEKASTTCGNPTLNYSYRIDLFSNGSMDVQSSLDTITGNLPAGEHRVFWRATNACGVVNNSCEYTVFVKDCQNPNLVCINGLTQSLDVPNCTADFTASQFILNMSDNCSPSEDLQIAMRKAGDGTGFPEQDSVFFDECDLGLNFLEVWVKDVNGLTNICQTYVLIQENNSGCTCNPDGDIALHGCARTADNQKLNAYTVEAHTVSTAGVQPPVDILQMQNATDSCYSFAVAQLPFDADYKTVVRAWRSDAAVAGVTTFDLVKMSRHILNLEPFSSIYQVLAADVNNSNTVSTFDIVETRKVILGINDTFSLVPVWRFVRPVLNPADIDAIAAVKDTYQISLPALNTDVSFNNLNFVGFKMGDANLSASFTGEADDRGARPALGLLLNDPMLQAGARVDIPVALAQGAALAGWQLALQFDPERIRILGVDGLPAEYYRIEPDGRLRLLWYDTEQRTFAPGDALFSLHIEVLQTGRLSRALRPDPAALPAEGADMAGTFPLEVRYRGHAAPGVQLAPPAPNPFQETTRLGLDLRDSAYARLRLYDLRGSLLFDRSYALEPGAQTIELNREVFPSPGLYVYRLECGGEVLGGKVVRY